MKTFLQFIYFSYCSHEGSGEPDVPLFHCRQQTHMHYPGPHFVSVKHNKKNLVSKKIGKKSSSEGGAPGQWELSRKYFSNEDPRSHPRVSSVNLKNVWPCILYKTDEKCQLDAKIVIYYHKISLHVSGIYMPIFRITCFMLLHMVYSTRCSGCNPEGPACSPVHCALHMRAQARVRCKQLFSV